MRGKVVAQTSKLVTNVATAPPAKSSTPLMWVGVSTWITCPRLSSLPITRSGNEIWAEDVTRTTGPSRAISAVR